MILAVLLFVLSFPPVESHLNHWDQLGEPTKARLIEILQQRHKPKDVRRIIELIKRLSG
jgi:hypothetical protein